MNWIRRKLQKRKFNNIKKPITNFSVSYEGYVRVESIYDADTITTIFKYNKKYQRFKVRLFGIDAPELRTENKKEKIAGLTSRNRLCEMITKKKFRISNKKGDITNYLQTDCFLVYIKTRGFDKYGRILADIYKNKGDKKTLNQKLIDLNLAYKYDGGTKKKFKP